MKTIRITIEVPLPDEGTQEDAEKLAEIIERTALTSNPAVTSQIVSMLGSVKVFGTVTNVSIV